jgi:hypothetical protein
MTGLTLTSVAITCDECSKVIPEGRTCFDVRAGTIQTRLRSIDLCPTRAERFRA